jgi:branched-chain amino acid transport system permease protein
LATHSIGDSVEFIQLVISGVAQGCIYGLIALGFVLIYKATETVSFAQGDLMMLGAFCGLGRHDAAGLSVLAGGAGQHRRHGPVRRGLERAVIRPILGQPAFSIVMLTIGIGYVARGAITMIPGIGTETHACPCPTRTRSEPGRAGAERRADGGDRRHRRAGCCALFRFSLGIAMQAASQNQLAAYYMGIPVKRLNGLVWGLAAAVAAIAGLLLAPITFVHANMGFIGLKAFPAAVVGGFGSLPGAIVGGLVIGVVESLSGFYLPEGFKDIAAYMVVLLMLMVKPNGLFGESCEKGLTTACASSSRPTTSRTSAWPSTAGSVLVRPAAAGPAGRALAAARILAGAAHLHPHLRHRRPGADAAGRLHRAVLAGPRGLSGRGRLHAGGAGRPAGRFRWPWPARPCWRPRPAWWSACRRCASRASTWASPRWPSASSSRRCSRAGTA